MDYIKIRFGSSYEDIDSKFKETIGEMFTPINQMFSCSNYIWKPQMDIYETPDMIIVLAEIAGVNKEDLEVEISNKAVKIFPRESYVKVVQANYLTVGPRHLVKHIQ